MIKTPLPPFRHAGQFAWFPTKDGSLTTRSAYWFFFCLSFQNGLQEASSSSNNDNQQKRLWKAIWESNLLPKVSIWAWQVIQQRLPCFTSQKKRKFLHNDMCWCIAETSETIHHIFYDCHIAKDTRAIFHSVCGQHNDPMAI